MQKRESVRGVVLCACGLAAVAWAIGPLRRAWGGPPKEDIVLLFTPQEARKLQLTDHEWRHVPRARALPAGPEIIVRRPQIKPGEVPTIETQSPTDLDVIFEPRDAPVRMDSLNVEARKGFFSRSLTEMLRPYIHGDSIEVSQVQIPTGRFLLDISIADTSGNTSDTTYRLEVSRK